MTSSLADLATLPRPQSVKEPRIVRPIQYLGSKMRSLDAIIDAADQLDPSGGPVADIFTGTSVVAQRFAGTNRRVHASDSLEACATLARALLGVGRQTTGASLCRTVVSRAREVSREAPWQRWVDAEQVALELMDGPGLLAVGRDVPQRWSRRPAKTEALEALFLRQDRAEGLPSPSIISSHYAGTYFGVRQANEMDSLRESIEGLASRGDIDDWEEAVALTALLGCASDCAFSAGKHFAQPLGGPRIGDREFAAKRIVKDRAVDVYEVFLRRMEAILEASSSSGVHQAEHAAVEEFIKQPGRLRGASLIYADPPYTAQQYSRFYHVLEVLARNTVPPIQVVGGQVTSGIYPRDRFKSRFSSKRLAGQAFKDLCDLASKISSSLLISYSGSSIGSNGNARMISLGDLMTICTDAFGSRGVELVTLSHAYRQFNSGNAAVREREDTEYLILCAGKVTR